VLVVLDASSIARQSALPLRRTSVIWSDRVALPETRAKPPGYRVVRPGSRTTIRIGMTIVIGIAR
jgi:hypothetical protein